MDKFKAFLSKRVGGIPVMAFVALGAGVVLFYAWKMSPSQSDTESPTDTAPDGDAGSSGDTSQPVFAATPTIVQPSGVPDAASVSATPQQDTNELWSRRAIAWLIGQGVSVNNATGAITKYLDGESLSADEAKIRDRAIGQYGLPPESIPYAPDTPAPSKSTATHPPTPVTPAPAAPKARRQGTPPLMHTVQGSNDNTYVELALLYYGSNATGLVQRIQAQQVNLKYPPRQGIPVGAKVRIPKPETHWFTATAKINNRHTIAAKNGISVQQLDIMNPALKFPVKPGTRVQVG